MDQVPSPPNNQYENNVPYNDQQYNRGNEPQEPKNNIVKKIIIAFIIITAVIGTLAFGGFYLVYKNAISMFGDNNPLIKDNSISSSRPTPKPTVGPKLDSDNDGMFDLIEKTIGTNPNKMDSDGDSYNDLPEIKSGYSPNIPGEAGKLTPEQLQALKNKIKSIDESFYEKTFGTEASPTISTPNPTVNPTISLKTTPTATASAKKDFSSPEATLKSFVASYETNDIRNLLDTFNKATIFKLSEEADKNNGQLSFESMFDIGLFDIFYHQTKYVITDNTNRYTIMAPEKREIEGGKLTGLVVNPGQKATDYSISQRPDVYFEKEDGAWKINMNASILDMNLRKTFAGKQLEEMINYNKTEWKKSLE